MPAEEQGPTIEDLAAARAHLLTVLRAHGAARARFVAALRARPADMGEDRREPAPGREASEPGHAGRDPAESTVGTGSAVAIGCTLIMLVLTLLGVLVLVLTRWI
jgi:hypothetical protein